MVAPVSGPFYKFPSVSFGDAYQQTWKQKKPYDLPLAYKTYYYYGKSRNVSTDVNGKVTVVELKEANFSPRSSPNYNRMAQHAYNRAYEKLKAKLSDKAGWAENLAQINKSRRTIIDRSVQLARFTGALRKGRFGECASILRTPVPSKVSNRKATSQNFLEWEYGIKPIMTDLESSLKILVEADFGDLYLKGRAREVDQWVTVVDNKYAHGAFSYSREQSAVFIHRQCVARCRVTNPNLFLANQLGVVDLALPWKLMPFSFVVDWFVNVEQVISSVTDWYGVSLFNPHYTKYDYGARSYSSRGLNVYTSFTPYKYAYANGAAFKSCMEMERVMSLPGPSLVIKPFRGISLNRAAQAIALVLSVFGR